MLAAGMSVAAHGAAPEPPTTGLGVTRVTISADGQALSGVLADISAQAKVRFLVDANEGRTPITLQAGGRPLWETLMAALNPVNTEGACVFQMDDGTAISAVRYSGKACATGPFLVLASRVVHQADYRRPDGDAEQFYVEVQVLVDPALHGLYAQGDNAPARAVDDAGTSLAPAEIPAARTVPLRRQPFGPTAAVPTRIVLSRPALPLRLGSRIASLQGEIPIAVAAQVEKVELDVPGKAERVLGGVKGTFECTVSETGGVQVSASFDRPDGISDEAWNEIDKRLYTTELRVLDADGQAWPAPSGSSARYGPKVRSMSRSFSQSRPGFGRAGPAAGSAAKAVVEVNTEIQTVAAPYRFVDLPLP